MAEKALRLWPCGRDERSTARNPTTRPTTSALGAAAALSPLAGIRYEKLDLVGTELRLGLG